MLRTIAIALAGAVSLSVAAVPAALSQTQPPAAAAPAAPDVSGIGTDTRRAFAVAYLDVAQIGQANQERLLAAEEDADEQERIIQDVTAEMTKAIEETPGITLQEYSTIAQAVQTDPELVEEINGYVRELAPQTGE